MSAALTLHTSSEMDRLSEKAHELITTGNLVGLTPAEKVIWYKERCAATGLDYRTSPFQYVTLPDGKVVLYATKTAAEQASEKRGLSLIILDKKVEFGLFVVTCKAQDATGRSVEDLGAVPVEGLKGLALANAMMKTMTKAKRRTVLSFCGMGMLDETEVDDIPGARVATVEQMHSQSIQQGESTIEAAYTQEEEARSCTPKEYRDDFIADAISVGIAAEQIEPANLSKWAMQITQMLEQTPEKAWKNPVMWYEASECLRKFHAAQPSANLEQIAAACLRFQSVTQVCEMTAAEWHVLATEGLSVPQKIEPLPHTPTVESVLEPLLKMTDLQTDPPANDPNAATLAAIVG